jgi:hypothetical protein
MQSSSASLLQLVKVWLDKGFLQTTKGAGEILTCLENANVAAIIEKLPVENSIFWTRSSSSSKKADQNNKDVDTTESQHDHILVKVECDAFVEYVSEFCGDDEDENGSGGGGCGGDTMRLNSELVKYVRSVKRNAQVTQVTMLVPGFKQFFK